MFRQRPKKNCYANLQITLPDSPHPVIIISKNLGFQALYVARQNEFWFFSRLINTKFFYRFWPMHMAFTVAQRVGAERADRPGRQSRVGSKNRGGNHKK